MQDTTNEPDDLLMAHLAAARRRIAARKSLRLTGLYGGSKVWMTAALSETTPGTVVVMCESLAAGEEFRDDLRLLVGAEQVFFFPHWDTIPYDAFSPNKELVGQRFAAMLALREGRCPILVTTAQAAIQGMIPPEVFDELCFSVEVGGRFPRGSLVQRLVSAGYVRVDLVEAPGSSASGGILLMSFHFRKCTPCGWISLMMI